jgi:hypothetical protein
MPSETLAVAAQQLADAGFRQVKHEVSGGMGNEYYDFAGLGAVIRLVRDQGEEKLVIEAPDGSGWDKPSRWLRTENSQMSLTDCVLMTITRQAELRSASNATPTDTSDRRQR